MLSHTTRLDDTPLRLDIEGLHRVGQVAAVELRLANRAPAGTDRVSIDDTFSADGYSADVGGILLLDSRTGQPLTALGAGEADLTTELAPGGTQMIRAAFRAPRGDRADVLARTSASSGTSPCVERTTCNVQWQRRKVDAPGKPTKGNPMSAKQALPAIVIAAIVVLVVIVAPASAASF